MSALTIATGVAMNDLYLLLGVGALYLTTAWLVNALAHHVGAAERGQ